MFGKFTVNSQDWHAMEGFFKDICPQIVDFYLQVSPEQPWKHNITQRIMDVYTATYNLCTAKESRNERMYSFFQKTLEEFLQLFEDKQFEKEQDTDLLVREIDEWYAYTELVRICRQIFQYLDRYYVVDAGLESLAKKALIIYQSHLAPSSVIRIFGEFRKQMRGWRGAGKFWDDRLLVVAKILKSVSVATASDMYEQLCRSIKEETVDFYQQQYEAWCSQDPEVYIRNILELMSLEKEAFALMLPSEDSVMDAVFAEEIIRRYLPTLEAHERGLKLFLKEERTETLNQVFGLLRKFGSVEELKKQYYSYVRSKGFELFDGLKREDTPSSLIQAFASFYQHILSWTNKAFEGEQEFSIETRKVMETIVHLHDEEFSITDKLVSCLSDYFSFHGQIQSLQHCQIVFDCLTNKDAFIQAYESDLTNRFMNSSQLNLEEELRFIEGLRKTCGDNFTEALEGKIMDYNGALILNKAFATENPGMAVLQIKVLSRKFWVVENKPEVEYSSFNITWPQELIHMKTTFEEYYMSRHLTRHIQHLPLLSTLVLQITHRAQPHLQKSEIKLNLFQGALLIFIEKSNSEVTEAQILTNFAVTPQLLNSQLKSLVQGSNPLLLIGQQGFKYNNLFSAESNDLEREPINIRKNSKAETLGADRELSIQGSIVKILKGKSSCQLYQLIEEVKKSLRVFKPPMAKIKQAIERLIEKEFIQRDPINLNQFMYKA